MSIHFAPHLIRDVRHTLFACALLLPFSAEAADNSNVRSQALSKRSHGPSDTLFETLNATQTGIDFVQNEIPDNYRGFLSLFGGTEGGTPSGGVCVGDYNSDGRPDIYLTQPYGSMRLYRNAGDFRFEDVTEQAGLGTKDILGMGASWADINGDGHLDLYLCVDAKPNRLYVNQGDGTFREDAAAHGLNDNGPSIMMAFADYDLDGDLDGYLLTNRGPTPKMPPGKKPAVTVQNGVPMIEPKYAEFYNALLREHRSIDVVDGGSFDHLYRNNGDGTFTDVSKSAGIAGNFMGLSATWWDYDNDGFPDLYVANDYFGPDQLYHNEGNGRFKDVTRTALPHTPWFSMGADYADINNDGLLDFMASDMSGSDHYKQKVGMGDMAKNAWFLSYPTPRQYMRNALYLNTGTARFMEVAYLCGVDSTDWTWSPLFGDLDNDGWVDLFVSNGMLRDFTNSDLLLEVRSIKSQAEAKQFTRKTRPKRDINLAFRNRGDLRFEKVEKKWGLDRAAVSFGAALSDLDGDGDLDVIVNNFEESVSVYRNHSRNSSIRVRLVGTKSNRHGIGARLELTSASGTQVRYLGLTHGYAGATDATLHFGTGTETQAERLTVYWPSGRTQIVENIQTDRLYTLTEPEQSHPNAKQPEKVAPLFAWSQKLRGAIHRERIYDDFDRQPLLPNKLSQLGPGIACGDVDGDGDEDLYLGGAAGAVGRLYVRAADGTFTHTPQDAFRGAEASEDMAPLFFDADSDGDLDLFVVSGGVECAAGDKTLRDRLYLNSGQGVFSPAPPSALPALTDSGGVVAAADYDRDGDLDLFVGGRLIPGAYPQQPNSRILENRDGRFVDVTQARATGLMQKGMVTSAIWTDVNGDGWIDLMITYDWAAVGYWQNKEGTFHEQSGAAGLDSLKGWWNGIASADLDHDGDMDYVLTNVGLNTKYHASADHPQRLYYGQLDASGKRCILEAEFEGDRLLPVRGKSCSQNVMPFIKGDFPTFHDFASASLSDIYGEKRLQNALQLEVTTLESGVLLNDGSGHFKFAPLPRLAQAAPGFGLVLTDLNADGHTDVYMVQNFFGPQPETGRMDGGISLMLKGLGDGTFAPVETRRSGIILQGDSKALITTDLNRDGWPDLIATQNNGETYGFHHRQIKGKHILKVGLKGKPGNPTSVGARITLHLKDGSTQTAEVNAGGGYLSQSSADLFFGLGSSGQADKLVVRWPDGNETSHLVPADQYYLILKAR
jgi:hypothetical protein